MRFLILNTDYHEFLRGLYTQHPELEHQSYEEQMQARVDSLFGVADFYSSNLRRLGHEAYDIHANNQFMQQAWARERSIRIEEPGPVHQQIRKVLQRTRRVGARTPLRHLKPLLRPLLRPLAGKDSWFYQILAAQIEQYKPDVLLNQDMAGIDAGFLREMKPYIRLLCGQIASPLREEVDMGCYDLVISSLPNFVDYFRRKGLPAELQRLAFEPHIFDKLRDEDTKVSVSFVGSLSTDHRERVELLENLCARLDVNVWGQGVEGLPTTSPIRRCHRGQAWGIGMYRILRNSKISLNHHIGVAEDYANNMRLFEATGVGVMLITDWKKNLSDLFEPGREVIAYRSPEECVELIGYYLEHDDERETIGRAGQERTHKEHNYHQRMEEFVKLTERCLQR